MTRNLIIKGLVAIFSSLVFLAGFGTLFGSISFWGAGRNWFELLLPFLISASACLLLGWVNSKSFIRGLIGAGMAMIIGLPISYLLLAPIAENIIKSIIPRNLALSLGLSGSFSGIWFLVLPIVLIELVTDNVVQQKRWLKLIIGVLVSLLILMGIEVFTLSFGQINHLSGIRLTIYGPVLWGITVVATNYGREETNETKN